MRAQDGRDHESAAAEPEPRSAGFAGVAPGSLTPASILALQRAAGNAAVGSALAKRTLARATAKTGPRAMKRPPATTKRVPGLDEKTLRSQVLWVVPSANASVEQLANELDISLRASDSGTEDWMHIVITRGQMHVVDPKHGNPTVPAGKPLGTFRIRPDARLPPDGVYRSVFAAEHRTARPRWRTRRLGTDLDGDEAWIQQGVARGGDFQIERWLIEEDVRKLYAVVPPDRTPAIGMIVSGYGEAGSGGRAKNQVGRLRARLARGRKGPRARGVPDSVMAVAGKRGLAIRLSVDSARQDIAYRAGESDAQLWQRVQRATEKLRDDIDPSLSVRITDGAQTTEIDDARGSSEVELPEGFEPTPDGLGANRRAYPARIISHGPGGDSGRESTVQGARLDFTMKLDYEADSAGWMNLMFHREQFVAYKWELIDVSKVDPKSLEATLTANRAAGPPTVADMPTIEELTKPGKTPDSGITGDLKGNLSNTWEDTKADLESIWDAPWKVHYLSAIAVSDIVSVGGAVIDAMLTSISQPVNDRSIDFGDRGVYILRCFAWPIVTKEYAERARAAGRPLRIRAPSSAMMIVDVAPINQRATQVVDAEDAAIAALRAQLDNPPKDKTREEVQAELDAAIAARGDNLVEAVDRNTASVLDELDRISRWRVDELFGVPLDERDAELRLWHANLDFQGIKLGPYEEGLRAAKKQMAEDRKRYTGFGQAGIKGRPVRPRMILVSEDAGQVIPILANLAEGTESREGRHVWKLIDVTSAQTQDVYEGAGATHAEAIRRAFVDFRENCEYGRGSLAIRLPTDQLSGLVDGETVTVDPLMRVTPGAGARAITRLQDLATAAEIATIYVSGPARAAIGVAGSVASGVVETESLRRRAAADRLKLDAQTAFSILGIVGAAASILQPAAARTAKAYGAAATRASRLQLGTHADRLKRVARLAKWLGDKLHLVERGMTHAQWIVIPLSMYHEFAQIAAQEQAEIAQGGTPSRAKYTAMRLEALTRGIKSGLIHVHGLTSPVVRRPAREQQVVMRLADVAQYIDSGLLHVSAADTLPDQATPAPKPPPVHKRPGGKTRLPDVPHSVETPAQRDGRTDAVPGDRTPPDDIPFIDLPEGSVMYGGDKPLTPVEARRMYENTIAHTKGREALIMRNLDTGEYIVIQGTEGGVNTAPDAWNAFATERLGGRWINVRHYHPIGAGDVTPGHGRYPSLPDLAATKNDARRTGQPRNQAIDIVTEHGSQEIWYGYDPTARSIWNLWRGRPYWVDLPGPNGTRVRREFGSAKRYQAWVAQQSHPPAAPRSDQPPPVDPLHGKGLQNDVRSVHHRSVAELRAAIRAALQNMPDWGEATATSALKNELQTLLTVEGGRYNTQNNRDLIAMLPDVFRIVHDPVALEMAMVRLWEAASQQQIPVRAALERHVQAHGDKIQDLHPRPADENGDVDEVKAVGVMRERLRQGPIRDLALAYARQHGAHVHMFLEYVLDMDLGPGAGKRFRLLVADADGPVRDGKEFWQRAWDATFDIDGATPGNPEIMGPILQDHLGLPRWDPDRVQPDAGTMAPARPPGVKKPARDDGRAFDDADTVTDGRKLPREDELPEGTIMYGGDRSLTPAEARTMYENAIADSEWHEALIMRNVDTGELIVIQGHELGVKKAPDAWADFIAERFLAERRPGRWVNVRHYHTVGEDGLTPQTLRYPSGALADLGLAERFARLTGRPHSEIIDIVTEDGRQEIRYGYDQTSRRPYWVDLPGPGGVRIRREFKSLESYHEWYEQQTGVEYPTNAHADHGVSAPSRTPDPGDSTPGSSDDAGVMKVLPAGAIIYGDTPFTPAQAKRVYENTIADAEWKLETAIAENDQTGELIVVQGDGRSVSHYRSYEAYLGYTADRPGTLSIIRHNHAVSGHPEDHYPSVGDVEGAQQTARRKGRSHLEWLDIRTERGRQEIRYGCDATGERPIWVELPAPDGTRLPAERFASPRDYHRWLERQTGAEIPFHDPNDDTWPGTPARGGRTPTEPSGGRRGSQSFDDADTIPGRPAFDPDARRPAVDADTVPLVEPAGTRFREPDLDAVEGELARLGDSALVSAFRELRRQGGILPLTEDALRQVFGSDEATRLIKGGFLRVHARFDRRSGHIFVRGAALHDFTSGVVHELVHKLQEEHRPEMPRFMREFEAYAAQRHYLQRLIVEGVDPDTAFPEHQLFATATDDAIVSYLAARRLHPPADFNPLEAVLDALAGLARNGTPNPPSPPAAAGRAPVSARGTAKHHEPDAAAKGAPKKRSAKTTSAKERAEDDKQLTAGKPPTKQGEPPAGGSPAASPTAVSHEGTHERDTLVGHGAPTVVHSSSSGGDWTHEQMHDLFTRAFQRPGPPRDSLVIHKTRAEFEAAAKAGGFKDPERVRAFVDSKEQKLHLPPGAETLTVMHEALHFAGRQSGVNKVLGRYLEEGMTEWLARLEFGPRARRVYEQNVAFVERLAEAVGEDTLRNAYLHGQWDPLHTRLIARLGSEEKVQLLYDLLLQIDARGHYRIPLDEANALLWPGRAPVGKPPTSSPPATGTPSTPDLDETTIDIGESGTIDERRFRADGPLEAHRAKFLDRNRKGWERPDAVKLDPERFEDLGDNAIHQGWTKDEGACRLLKDKSTDEIWLFKAEIDEAEDIVGDSMPLDSYPRRAIAGETAARRTGMFTPEVHLVEWNGSRGSMQRWINGAVTLSELQERRRAGMALYRRIIASPEYVRLRNRLKAFDYLVQNLDRSDGNFLLVLGDTGRLERLIPIDHDRVFPAMHERLLIGRAGPLPAKYSRVTYDKLKDMALDPEGLTVALRGVLYDDEVARALDRLEVIVKDIEDKLARVGEAGTFLD